MKVHAHRHMSLSFDRVVKVLMFAPGAFSCAVGVAPSAGPSRANVRGAPVVTLQVESS